MPTSDGNLELMRLAARLDALRAHLMAAAALSPAPAATHLRNQASAANLRHYLALRQHDVRSLQTQLAQLGLSSLGRSEAHVLASVDAVRRAVLGLAAQPVPDLGDEPIGLAAGERQLVKNAAEVFGAAGNGRWTRIMVTLPRAAAADPQLVHDVVAAGAELVRIDCASGDESEWAAMIAHVRSAEALHGRTVRIAMDLAGPRPRTGPIAPGAPVLRLKPRRDELGRTTQPALVWLTQADGPGRPGAVTVPVESAQWLARRAVGDRVELSDTRDAARQLVITAVLPEGSLARASETTYLATGTRLGVGSDVTEVAGLPRRERILTLRTGDRLNLVRDLTPADVAVRPAQIGCTPPEIFDSAVPGQRVFIDDGAVGGVIERATDELLEVVVTDAAPDGSRLGARVPVGFPDTRLPLPALTAEDLHRLPFVAAHADVVGLPYVREPADVIRLQQSLFALGAADLPVIVRVETLDGLGNLPSILFAAMRSPFCAVVVDRGDLALEAGCARLSEVQEEVLALCEAAHVPVIWATDVLNLLARTGRPSRAEVTDAATAGHAECVLLGEGPFAASAVDFLADVLSRVAENRRKKISLLRPSRTWSSSREQEPVALG